MSDRFPLQIKDTSTLQKAMTEQRVEVHPLCHLSLFCFFSSLIADCRCSKWQHYCKNVPLNFRMVCRSSTLLSTLNRLEVDFFSFDCVTPAQTNLSVTLAESIENIFDLSFLVSHGKVRIFEENKQLFIREFCIFLTFCLPSCAHMHVSVHRI